MNAPTLIPGRPLTKATDVALLKFLLEAGRRWQTPQLVRDAAAWVTPEGMSRNDAAHILTGMHASVRYYIGLGLVETRKHEEVPGITVTEFRLAEGITAATVRSLAGGIDPRTADQDVCRDSHGKKRIEFQPLAFMSAKTIPLKIERAIHQCPSPWDYAQRIARIDNLKHTRKDARA